MNIAKLSHITILQLVHSDMKIDKPSVKGIKTFFVAVIGAGSLAIGYAALINIKALSLAGFPIATVATTLGTYLIFISLLPLTIKLLKKLNH